MTHDAIALTRRRPEQMHLLAALMAAGPEGTVEERTDGALLRLSDTGGLPLATLETPVLLQVPGETQRLLDVPADGPLWWTEVRAASATPEAGRLAAAMAGRVAALLDGAVWPPSAARIPAGDVVRAASTAPAADRPAREPLPAADIESPHAVVVLQDRPLVPLSPWISEMLGRAEGRACQLVTPEGSRLTLALRAALLGGGGQWVVRERSGACRDGLTGAALTWDGQRFAPAGGGALPTGSAPPAGVQVSIDLRVRHDPTAELRLGGALEAAWRHMTGRPPAGWGTAEPVTLPWSREALTALARERAPRPTLLLAVGPDTQALLRVRRTRQGVTESVSLTHGLGPGGGLPGELDTLLRAVQREGEVQALSIRSRAARPDLTVPARREGDPVPLYLAVAAREVPVLPRTPLEPRRVGTMHCWHLPGDPDAARKAHGMLMRQLAPEGRLR